MSEEAVDPTRQADDRNPFSWFEGDSAESQGRGLPHLPRIRWWVGGSMAQPAAVRCARSRALQAADSRTTSRASAAAHAITMQARSTRSREPVPTSRSCASRMKASTGRDAPLFPEQ